MNSWIVVTGPPGSGKSTLRRRLARKLGGLSFDIIDCYPKNTCFDTEAANLAFSRLTSRLKVNRPGPKIVEAMFYQNERRQAIEWLARESDANVVFVQLDAELDCLKARVAGRKKTLARVLTADRIRELRARFRGYRGDLTFRTDRVAIDDIAAKVEHRACRRLRRDNCTA